MQSFKEALRERDFVVTAECFLRPETSADALRAQAELLRDHVDAVVLTDNQYGKLHMSTPAAARLFLNNKLDPIVQLSCRNRNRIALVADLLGAAALGVSSFQLVRGNRVPSNIDPRPKAVLDVNAAQLIGIATNLQKDADMQHIPELLIGGAITAHEPKADWQPRNVQAKVEAGARFMLSYICMDLALLRRYMQRLVASRLTHRVSVVISTALLSSADDAQYLRDNRPNFLIPESLVERMSSASDPKTEGVAICAEQIRELATIPGVSGVNLVATQDLASIPVAVDKSGLLQRNLL